MPVYPGQSAFVYRFLNSGKLMIKMESVKSKVSAILKKIEKEDKGKNGVNSFLHLNPDALKEAEEIDKKIKSGRAGRLAGKIVAVKSNINVRGLIACCASKTL